MGEGNHGDYEKILSLREKIEELSQLKLIQKFSKEHIEEAEKEKRWLNTIKNTLNFLRAEHLLVNAGFHENAQRISVMKNGVDGRRTDESRTRLPMTIIGMMLLSVIMIFLLLGSWVEINGTQFNLLDLNQNIRKITDLGSSSSGTEDTLEVVSFFLIVGCLTLWACAVLYGGVVIRLWQRKETKLPFRGMISVIVLFGFLWISAEMITAYIGEETGGFAFVRINMTQTAWAALIISCVLEVSYYKREEINKIFGETDSIKEKLSRIYPVTNYYPWKEIRFISLILEQKEDITFLVRYVVLGEEKHSKIEKENNIVADVDIWIKTRGRDYVINNCKLDIDYAYSMNVTNELAIEGIPFGINSITDVKIIINSLGDLEGAVLLEPRVYAESGMNSFGLRQYRDRIGNITAVSKARNVTAGWICSCGLYHENSEKQCNYCFDSCLITGSNSLVRMLKESKR